MIDRTDVMVKYYVAGRWTDSTLFTGFSYRTGLKIDGVFGFQKGKVPIIAGGSGLYMKALLDGLFPSPKSDTRLRQKLREEADVIKDNLEDAKLKLERSQEDVEYHTKNSERIKRKRSQTKAIKAKKMPRLLKTQHLEMEAPQRRSVETLIFT